MGINPVITPDNRVYLMQKEDLRETRRLRRREKKETLVNIPRKSRVYILHAREWFDKPELQKSSLQKYLSNIYKDNYAGPSHIKEMSDDQVMDMFKVLEDHGTVIDESFQKHILEGKEYKVTVASEQSSVLAAETANLGDLPPAPNVEKSDILTDQALAEQLAGDLEQKKSGETAEGDLGNKLADMVESCIAKFKGQDNIVSAVLWNIKDICKNAKISTIKGVIALYSHYNLKPGVPDNGTYPDAELSKILVQGLVSKRIFILKQEAQSKQAVATKFDGDIAEGTSTAAEQDTVNTSGVLPQERSDFSPSEDQEISNIKKELNDGQVQILADRLDALNVEFNLAKASELLDSAQKFKEDWSKQIPPISSEKVREEIQIGVNKVFEILVTEIESLKEKFLDEVEQKNEIIKTAKQAGHADFIEQYESLGKFSSTKLDVLWQAHWALIRERVIQEVLEFE